MFLAEITAVNVDDKYINEEGRLELEKAGLVAYVHGHYYSLGRKLGKFGFSVNKAKIKLAQKMANVEVEIKPTKKSLIEKAASKFGKASRSARSINNKRKNADEKHDEINFSKHKKKYNNNKCLKYFHLLPTVRK